MKTYLDLAEAEGLPRGSYDWDHLRTALRERTTYSFGAQYFRDLAARYRDPWSAGWCLGRLYRCLKEARP